MLQSDWTVGVLMGRCDEGLRLLEEGKQHLVAIANETELALLLCQYAEGHALARDVQLARSAFEEAKKVAGAAKSGDAPFELKSALKRVEALLARESATVA